MFRLVIVVLVSLLIALASSVVSASFLNKNDLIGGFLLNVAAEALGIGFGLLGALWVATRVARERLDAIAPKIVKLIAQLRRDGLISPGAARAAVVCTVQVVSERPLAVLRGPASVALRNQSCSVCSLEVEVVPQDADKRCAHCGLSGSVWEA